MKHTFEQVLKNVTQYTGFILYGNDEGKIYSFSRDLIAKYRDKGFDVQYLSMVETKEQLHRMLEYLIEMPLFQKENLIVCTLSLKLTKEFVAFISEHPLENTFILKQNRLTPKDLLRQYGETEKNMAIIPCYPDNFTTKRNFIRTYMDRYGINISSNIINLLAGYISDNRGMAQGDLDTLILYVGERKAVDNNDVISCFYSVVEEANLPYVVLTGRVDLLNSALSQLRQKGFQDIGIIRMIKGYVWKIVEARSLVKTKGMTPTQAAKITNATLFGQNLTNFIQLISEVRNAPIVATKLTKLEDMLKQKSTNIFESMLFSLTLSLQRVQKNY